MRYLSIAAVTALIFGAATLAFLLMRDVADRHAAERRAQWAERAAQAEAARRAEELAAQRAAQPQLNPVVPGVAPSFNPLNPLAAAGAQGGAAHPYDGPVREDLGGLPDTEGVEIVYYTCTACHGLDIVKQQHVTSARWDYLLTWMMEQQGMGDLGDDRPLVLDYLTRHFGAN